jgi:hypothetical protein
MTDHSTDSVYESEAPTSIYLACTAEDLIRVEMDAWVLGGDRASVDATAALASIAAIQEASEQACDAVLEMYIPLDVDRFRDVFTRAWCAGYCSRQSQPVSGPGTSTIAPS